MKQLVIIGASGHGKVVADIAQKNGYEKIIFLDDNEGLTSCVGYPVKGKSSRFAEYSCDFVVAIGNNMIRQKIHEELEANGKNLVTLIHPNAVIAGDAQIESGTVIMAGVVINPNAKIGKGCIINTCSSVDHDCEIGDYCHISVGAHLAGTVKMGKRVFICAGVTVINNIDICDDVIIGAGATVVKNIDESGIYVGVPARKEKKGLYRYKI